MAWQYKHTVLGLSTVTFVATMVARISISPVVTLITDDFGVSNGTIGIVLTGMWAMYALMQLPSGLLGDRFGERRILLLAMGLTAGSSLLLALSPGIITFSIFSILLGTAAGLHFPVATTLLDKEFENVSHVMGILLMGGPIAGLFVPPLAVYVGQQFGWRAAVLIGLAFTGPTTLLVFFNLQRTTPSQPDIPIRQRLNIGSLTEILARPSIAFTTVIAIIGAFFWQAVVSFLPTFLKVSGGLQPDLVGLLFSLTFIVHGLTQPTIGWLANRIGQELGASIPFSAGVIGFISLVLTDSFLGYILSVSLIGTAMSWGAPIQARFLDRLAIEEKGKGYGLVRTVHMMFGATGSAVVGTISEVLNWNIAFGSLAGITLVALILLLTNKILNLGY